MTFSQTTKKEILKTIRHIRGCCATSFLTAVLKSIGSLTIGYKSFGFALESENHEMLTFCKHLAEVNLGITAEIESSNLNVKGDAMYSCEFVGNIGEKLALVYRDDDGTMQINNNVDELLPQSDCCKRAFIQGLFVASGSVVIPLGTNDLAESEKRGKYHLELRIANAKFAQAVQQLFSEWSFHTLERKNRTILYLKESEKIADFLVYMGAMSSSLKLENVIIGRSLRNTANRQSNCISANIDKAIQASEKQLNAIATLRQRGLFDSLSEQLKEIALLRVEFPEAGLEELANRLGISKSGANHRLNRLIQLSQQD